MQQETLSSYLHSMHTSKTAISYRYSIEKFLSSNAYAESYGYQDVVDYLLVLKTLTINNHIKFEDDKTNAQYLNELKEKPFSQGFSYVSYLYNYIWYGEFSLEAAQYTKAKNNFTSLLKQVK